MKITSKYTLKDGTLEVRIAQSVAILFTVLILTLGNCTGLFMPPDATNHRNMKGLQATENSVHVYNTLRKNIISGNSKGIFRLSQIENPFWVSKNLNTRFHKKTICIQNVNGYANELIALAKLWIEPAYSAF